MITNPKNVHVLEYRLNDERKGYPAIYHFDNIDKMQIFCRKNCDYFLLENKVYENVSSSFENDRFVIYLEEVRGEKPYRDAAIHRPLGVEIRLFSEYSERKEITFVHCHDHEDVFSYLDNTFIYLNGKEHERVSAEIDQDRRIYILYVKPTGMELAE